MGLSRQEYWSGLLFPLPDDIVNPGIKPQSLCLMRWHAEFLLLLHALNLQSHSLLAPMVSGKKTAVNVIEDPLLTHEALFSCSFKSAKYLTQVKLPYNLTLTVFSRLSSHIED